jgi:hypothetical protein
MSWSVVAGVLYTWCGMKRASDTPPIILRSHPGLTLEQARDARAHAWAFVFDCYAKKTGRTRGGEDAMKGSNDDRASA